MSQSIKRSLRGAAFVLFALGAIGLGPGTAQAVDFSTDIRPIISSHCLHCHGPDAETREAELRLDEAAGLSDAFAGGVFEESEAWRRMQSDDPAERMPPPGFDKPLAQEELLQIQEWMEQGVPWAKHGAFTTPVRPKLPVAADVRNPLDSFLNDKTPNAYERLNLPDRLSKQCRDTDQPSAALVTDLKQSGLLDDTLIIWGGEFGRTVYSQGELTATNYGRDHHPRCFTMWLAGGGIKLDITYGATDDFSYSIVDKPTEVFDLNATILHLLGLEHTRLTYRFQGRDFRLTDVHGQCISEVIS